MILAGAATFLLFVFGPVEVQPNPPEAGGFVRQQIIIRVQRGTRLQTPAGASLINWQEGRGPRCIAASRIAGATLRSENSVDLVLRDSSRLRARLEQSCPALDYYYGFYLDATEDGQICADRDFIRSRVGGQCRIDQFRSLTPVRG
jgi:hypothetical protein